MIDYINPESLYGEIYYKFPKVFLYSSTYKDLSNDSKIAYMILRDRVEYSIQNNWVDEKNRIFFICTNDELMDLLNCSKPKVIKIKKELEKFELLSQIQQGLKKPNHLYLGNLNLKQDDVYLRKQPQSLGTQGSKNSLLQENKPQSLGTQGSKNSLLQENKPQSLGTQGSKDSLPNQYLNNNLDTNRHLIDTEQNLKQDRILLDNFVEIMKDDSIATFIPERVLELIKTFSSSYADAQQTVRTIHNAKNKAQKETGQLIAFEELENYGINADAGLYNTLLKAYQKKKTEQVGNIQNLIFVYVKNWFIEKPIAHKIQLDQENELPKVSVENWMQK